LIQCQILHNLSFIFFFFSRDFVLPYLLLQSVAPEGRSGVLASFAVSLGVPFFSGWPRLLLPFVLFFPFLLDKKTCRKRRYVFFDSPAWFLPGSPVHPVPSPFLIAFLCRRRSFLLEDSRFSPLVPSESGSVYSFPFALESPFSPPETSSTSIFALYAEPSVRKFSAALGRLSFLNRVLGYFSFFCSRTISLFPFGPMFISLASRCSFSFDGRLFRVGF